MIASRAYAAQSAGAALGPFEITRRAPRATDVVIELQYCGVCHSDIHQARDEWGGAIFPMVPGHELVGTVTAVGEQVGRFHVGERVGVGCLVDSCRSCKSCAQGLEQYCESGWVGTYNSRERGSGAPTYGGYSERVVVDQDFVLRIPASLDPAQAAPLLCAGVTTYSPLRTWNVGPGQRVGVVGLGGLGHMGVKLAHAFGAETVVFTTSESKRADALRLGADEVVISRDAAAMTRQAERFDFILDTVSAPHDLNAILGLLKRDGTLCLVGAPDKPPVVHGGLLVFKRRRLVGSLIGGIAETQEMLDFCAAKGIASDIELIKIQDINRAFDRAVAGDVKYRFVIDLQSLRT